MLPNEEFALACRAYYDEIGLVVDEKNGQFAHCPYPKDMGEQGYYLLWEHHQQQGLLQSKDVGKCCFFSGHTKQWLMECNPFPDNYFELWDIYEKYTSLHSKTVLKKVHAEKDELGRSLHTLKLHKEKDEFGRSLHTLRLHEKKDGQGRSLQALKLHEAKDELGRSIHAVKTSEKAHAKKDELGKSVTAVKAGKAGALKKRRRVQLTRIEDGEVFIFDSTLLAAETLKINGGNIANVCNGNRKTVSGYTAIYLDSK